LGREGSAYLVEMGAWAREEKGRGLRLQWGVELRVLYLGVVGGWVGGVVVLLLLPVGVDDSGGLGRGGLMGAEGGMYEREEHGSTGVLAEGGAADQGRRHTRFVPRGESSSLNGKLATTVCKGCAV
jgi:hypothetical protein